MLNPINFLSVKLDAVEEAVNDVNHDKRSHSMSDLIKLNELLKKQNKKLEARMNRIEMKMRIKIKKSAIY